MSETMRTIQYEGQEPRRVEGRLGFYKAMLTMVGYDVLSDVTAGTLRVVELRCIDECEGHRHVWLRSWEHDAEAVSA